jgi:prepilin-type N-terminal cleavage/methylation domain-containing protein
MTRRHDRHPPPAPAFSLVELVIVVVIIGIIGAIAIPRVTGMAEKSKDSRMLADLRALDNAAERFRAEHAGLDPGLDPSGTPVSAVLLARRLVQPTDDSGTPNPAGLFGPYLREWPTNIINGRQTVRINGVPSKTGLNGWRYDTTTGTFSSDATPSGNLHVGPSVDVVAIN